VETEIIEGDLKFIFPENITASQYDEWSFYRNQFLKNFDQIGGVKAVDFIAIDKQITWLIEVKDYRLECTTNAIELANVVAIKVRDTLAGLVAARNNAYDNQEKHIAKQALSNNRIRIVLHMEQPQRQNRLRTAIRPVDIKQKLKQRLKSIDAHPLVVNKNNLHSAIPWKVN
jgi:hypothetical protein